MSAHCESCRTMRYVAAGKTQITLWDKSLGKSTEGKAHIKLTTTQAMKYLREQGSHRNCRYSNNDIEDTPTIIKQIRRDGQRILQAGTNVYVQPGQRKGTKKYEGWIVECYDNNTVNVHVPGLGDSITVEINEFVKARRGTTTI